MKGQRLMRSAIITLFLALLLIPMAAFADGDGPTRPQYHVVNATLTIAGDRDLTAYVGDYTVNNFPQAGDRLDVYYEDGHIDTVEYDQLKTMRTRNRRYNSFQEGTHPVVTRIEWYDGQYYHYVYMGSVVTGVYNTESNIESIRFVQNTPIIMKEYYDFTFADTDVIWDYRFYQYNRGTAGDNLFVKYKGEPEERVYVCDQASGDVGSFVNQKDEEDVIKLRLIDNQEQEKWGVGDHEATFFYDGIKVEGKLKITIQEDPEATPKEKDITSLPVGHKWDEGRVLIEESEGVPGKVLYRCLEHSENYLLTGKKQESSEDQ